MATREYYRRISEAIGRNDAGIPELLLELQAEIEKARADLRVELDMMRTSVDYWLNGAIPAFGVVEESGLSESEKAAINRLIDEALNSQPDPSAEAMVELVTRSGIPLGDRVSNPAAVIGTLIHHAKRRREARMGQPAATTSAIAQPPETSHVPPPPTQPPPQLGTPVVVQLPGVASSVPPGPAQATG
jgi:hypothetical protein